MEQHAIPTPGLTLALALVIGILSQTVARHLKIPGIILLLFSGIIAGPEVLGIIRPDYLSGAIETLIGFAVGIILFEGGLNLNINRLKRQASSIRNLVSIGALITLFGGAITARFILQWEWNAAFLFGSLVIVTGPTVINPLMKRLRIKPKVATILEGEGIFIDAIGALLAIITLQIILAPEEKAWEIGGWHFFTKVGFGLCIGTIWGHLIATSLKWRKIIPHGLENVYTLAMVLLLFQLSNYFFHESGIIATIMAGLIVGNTKTNALEDLKEFKEQLTLLFIGMLFVLLASDVQLQEMINLGLPGLATVLVLMLVIRPLNVYLSTLGTDLKWQEKAFLAFMAPRGIVSAAIATLFAKTLQQHDLFYGKELQAMVFLVIILTVVINGITGSFFARKLQLQKPSQNGYVFYEASPLALTFANLLREYGEDSVFIDSNAARIQSAQQQNYKVVYGNGMDENILLRAEVDGRQGIIALSPYDEVNFLFLQNVKKYSSDSTWMPLNKDYFRIDLDKVVENDCHVLFGGKIITYLWNQRIEKDQVELIQLDYEGEKKLLLDFFFAHEGNNTNTLPLIILRKEKILFARELMSLEQGDKIKLLILKEGKQKQLDIYTAQKLVVA